MDESEAAKLIGSRGGKTTLKKYGKDHFSEMGKKSQRGKAKKKSETERKE